ISDTPQEAENMKARAILMRAINTRLDEFDWSQNTAAANLGLTQPRVSDLRRGKVGKFSLDALMEIAKKVGLVVELKISIAERCDLRH
ncbi:MAG: XRE family transcriptional regulator, partial [Nocardia sp.]|nr:XRE family transcriptional regulator [Nocardia sp.]